MGKAKEEKRMSIKLTEELINESNKLIDKYTENIIGESKGVSFNELLRNIRNCKFRANEYERELVEQLEKEIKKQALDRIVRD